MTTFSIKLIAIGLMVLDHIAAYLFPDLVVLRIVGRLSFPLFGWLIANGFIYTKNRQNYLLRLFVLALVSQVPFVLVNHIESAPLSVLNIFFTLSLGLAVLMLASYRPWIVWRVGVIMAGAATASVVPVEYGASGLLSMVAFYYSFNHLRVMLAAQLAIWGVFYTLPLALWLYGFTTTVPPVTVVEVFQPVAAASVGIIAFYNRQLGYPLKYAFYIFYPAHLLVLYWIRQLLL